MFGAYGIQRDASEVLVTPCVKRRFFRRLLNLVPYTERDEVFKRYGVDSSLCRPELRVISPYFVPLFSAESPVSDGGNWNKNGLAPAYRFP